MALWTPSWISTYLWLDASDTGTITTATGGVSVLADKSGNSRDAVQTVSSERPATGSSINGLNALAVAGADCLLAPLLFDSASAIGSVFVVMKHGYYYEVKILNTRNMSGGFIWTAWYEDLKYYHGGATPVLTTSTLSTIPVVAAFTRSSLNIKQYVAGGLKNTSTVSGYTASDMTQTQVMRGDGLFGELIVIDEVVDTATRQIIEGYLSHKWGLTSQLSSGHPYKSTAPTAPDPTGDGAISPPIHIVSSSGYVVVCLGDVDDFLPEVTSAGYSAFALGDFSSALPTVSGDGDSQVPLADGDIALSSTLPALSATGETPVVGFGELLPQKGQVDAVGGTQICGWGRMAADIPWRVAAQGNGSVAADGSVSPAIGGTVSGDAYQVAVAFGTVVGRQNILGAGEVPASVSIGAARVTPAKEYLGGLSYSAVSGEIFFSGARQSLSGIAGIGLSCAGRFSPPVERISIGTPVQPGVLRFNRDSHVASTSAALPFHILKFERP